MPGVAPTLSPSRPRAVGEVGGLGGLALLVGGLVHESLACGGLARWEDGALDRLADADRLGERRDRPPASARLVAEDDDPRMLRQVSIDEWVAVIHAQLATQYRDVFGLP